MEKGPDYYNKIFEQPYDCSSYAPIYEKILGILKGHGDPAVLEVGCGTGVLAKMLIDRGFEYRGFDFSEKAIDAALKQSRKIRDQVLVYLGDAYDPAMYGMGPAYQVVIATEVFEHLRDWSVLRNIRAGKRVIFSVPNFLDPAHLRVYLSKEDIRERFAGVLDIEEIYDFNQGDQTIFLVDSVRSEGEVDWTRFQLDSCPMPTISACMIVKNEEEFIAGCLTSIRNLADEIIIVDTGSTDRTIDIIEKFRGADYLGDKVKLYHHLWENDFSKHRNQSLEYATQEWILIIDADERWFQEDTVRLIENIRLNKANLVSVLVWNERHNEQLPTMNPSVRLFKRELNLRYEGIVHNNLAIPEKTPVLRSSARIHHLGYALSPAKHAAKLARSSKLLMKQMRDDPKDPMPYFNFGNLLMVDVTDFSNTKGDPEGALKAFRTCMHLTNGIRKMRHINLMCVNNSAWCSFFMGDWDKALDLASMALSFKKDYLDPLLLLGHCWKMKEKWPEAIAAYREYLDAQEKYDPSMDKHNIAVNNIASRQIAENCIKEAQANLEVRSDAPIRQVS